MTSPPVATPPSSYTSVQLCAHPPSWSFWLTHLPAGQRRLLMQSPLNDGSQSCRLKLTVLTPRCVTQVVPSEDTSGIVGCVWWNQGKEYLASLYNETVDGAQLDSKIIDKAFAVDKVQANNFLIADGPLQLKLMRRTITVFDLKNKLKGSFDSPIAKISNNFRKWWEYRIEVENQIRLFKEKHQELLARSTDSVNYIPKWCSPAITGKLHNLNTDQYQNEISHDTKRYDFLLSLDKNFLDTFGTVFLIPSAYFGIRFSLNGYLRRWLKNP